MGSEQGGMANFIGAEGIKPLDSGKWQLYWTPIKGVEGITYNVIKKAADGSYDPAKPIENTDKNYIITEDLRLIGNTCYMVHFVHPENGDVDKNTKEVCTGHKPYTFGGAQSLVSLRDGSYMLKWAQPPFAGAMFQVFSRKIAKDKESPFKLIESTQENFYNTPVISLDDTTCFRVRYQIENFPEDTNEKELCTAAAGNFSFAGITSVSSPGKGQIQVGWNPSDRDDVAGYRIYIGAKFDELIGQASGNNTSSFIVDNLLHAVVYTFGVRAVDTYGREDSNEVIMSFELKNHIPQIKSVALAVVDADQFGRPKNLACVVDYADEDDWQALTPKFEIKNSKRGNIGLVERGEVKGKAWQKTSNYTLIEDDNRADQIVCQLTINDGFDDSETMISEPYTIPDTPVIANGFTVEILQNSEADIVIARGEGLGYTDADNDEAVEITFTTEHGTVISGDPGAFTCADGSCTARFKPSLDFFTDKNLANPEYAAINYQVKAGDSISNVGQVKISVKPVPRALSFDMNADQDEDRIAAIGLTTVIDPATDEPSLFNGYIHPGNNGGQYPHKASKIYFRLRNPFVVDEFKGIVKLPTLVPPNSSCTEVDLGVALPKGMECEISCDADGSCPFIFRGHENVYGISTFDFAVVVDGVVSNYATVRVNILPSLRATGYNALSVEGKTFTIKFKEGLGYEGSGNGTTLNNPAFTITDLVGCQNPALVFTRGTEVDPISGNEIEIWTSDFVPEAGFKGRASFKYKVHATGPKNMQLVSNVDIAEIEFYPKPVATGFFVQSLENKQRTLPILTSANDTDPKGYYHMYGMLGEQLLIDSVKIARGYLVSLGSTVTDGTLDCQAAGVCSQEFFPVTDYYDSASATHMKFNYKIRVAIDPTLFNDGSVYRSKYGAIDPYIDDGGSGDPANGVFIIGGKRILQSDASAEGRVDIRPVPKVKPIDLVVRESTAAQPSSLNIVLLPGAANQYTHAFNYKAVLAALTSPAPALGIWTRFSCDVGGPNDGRCIANYKPALDQYGEIQPHLGYKVTINDPGYFLSSGNIDSESGELKIDVRPMPKPVNFSIAMVENADFAPSSKEIAISLDNGYTHAYSVPIKTLSITEQEVGGETHGNFGGLDCSNAVCKITFTPETNYFYTGTPFNYNVTITDARMGDLTSDTGNITLDIRPRPRTVNVGSLAAPQIVKENTGKTFVLKLGEQYTHAYGLKAKSVEVIDSVNYANSPLGISNCNPATGDCSITFEPLFGYEGAAYIDFKVKVHDPVLNEDLDSNVSRINIDVYPKPRTSGAHIYAPQFSTLSIPVQLRTGNLLNEEAFGIKDRLGYTHRRDDPAVSIAIANNPVKGNFTTTNGGQFSCDADGLCSVEYATPAFQVGDNIDTFTYNVTIAKEDLTSEVAGEYQIEIKPTAITHDFTKVTIENVPASINIARLDFGTGSGQGYEHPLAQNAVSFEITDVNKGSLKDKNGNPITLDQELPCDGSGNCELTFVPDPDYYSHDDNLAEAYFKYRVWSYDSDLMENLPSNESTATMNVRPRPKATGKSYTAKQGDLINLTLGAGAGLGYTYASGNGYVSDVIVVNGSAEKGTVNPEFSPCSSINGNCIGAVFNPAIENDDWYYGPSAKFQYYVKVYDAAYGDYIDSAPNYVTIEYRPRPKAQNIHFKLWQKSSVNLIVKNTAGYTHPYFDGTAATVQYRPSQINIVSLPSNGTLSPAVIGCSVVTLKCQTLFTPSQDYFYNPANGFLELEYKVEVQDPVLGPIESASSAKITIEVRPIPINIGKDVYGVQNIDKNVVINLGEAYLYPLSLPSPPTIVPDELSNGIILGSIGCNAAGYCTGTFQPAAEFVGNAYIDYHVTLFDPSIGSTVSSETKRFNITYYPIPHARMFDYSNLTHLKGWEGENYILHLIPGSHPSGGLCDSINDSIYNVPAGYTHLYCDDATGITIVGGSLINATLPANPKFTCTSGICTGTLVPNDPAADWKGFGVASLQYKVTIDPLVLQSADLSVEERAALTSDPGLINVEYYPIPRASGVTLENVNPALPFIYAIQGTGSESIVIKRCDDTAMDSCHLGYVQGYNEDAIQVATQNKINLNAINPINCVSGICTGSVTFANNYYSDPSQDNFASFEYAVKIGEKWSNYAPIKINVYPRPVAQDGKIAYGLENDDVPLLINLNDGYTHPFNDPARARAIKIKIPNAILVTSKGGFVDPNNTSSILANNQLDNAFVCDINGRCTATYRPNPSTGVDDFFTFSVQINAPAEMTEAQKGNLLSEQKAYRIKIFPKPITLLGLEVVGVEDQSSLFDIKLGSGYTHEGGEPATALHFFDTEIGGNFLMKVNKTNNLGGIDATNIACNATSCDYTNCSSGVCPLLFLPNTAVYSNSTSDCSAGGANCPQVTYKASVIVGPPENRIVATSEVAGSLRFNIRPRPKVNADIINLIAPEAEPITINLTNGPTTGYEHPFYDASSITPSNKVNGDLASAFDCATNATICTTSFVPTPGYHPTAINKYAMFDYKVTVHDPTPGIPDISGISSGGNIISAAKNKVSIEYRPKPVATNLNLLGIQEHAQTVTINLGNGYTHEYNKFAKSIHILANTVSKLTVDGCTPTNECTLACNEGTGVCLVPVTPSVGEYGNGSFQFQISVTDSAFTPAQELRSLSTNKGTVTIDLRPLPVAENKTYIVYSERDDAIKVSYGSEYNHPYADTTYNAITLTPLNTLPVGHTWVQAFSCDNDSGSPEYKNCSATYHSANNFYGLVTFNYKITVFDKVINQAIDSHPKTITLDVRPKPIATGLAQNWTIFESNPGQTLAIELGPVLDKKGYFYPNGADPQYDLDPSHIYIDTAPSAILGAFLNADFTCPLGRDPKGCTNIFVPLTYGSTNFVYRIEVSDPFLGSIDSDPSPATTIEIRPVIKAHNVTYLQNDVFKTIENQAFNWTIENGADLGYIYPQEALYDLARATITLIPSSPANGAVVADDPSCIVGVCSGTFTPTANVSGEASFQFKLGLTDAAITQGSNTYETSLYTATIDIFPQPTTNTDLVAYTPEGDSTTLTFRGSGQGYTHARDDQAFKVNVTGLLNGTTPSVGEYTSCAAGTCTLNFTPSAGFTSDSDSHVDGAYVNYRVWVKEATGTRREAQSKDPLGKFGVVVYPRSVPSAANIQNSPMWAANANVFSQIQIGAGNGYTHKWGHKASNIDITSTSAGLVENAGSSCNNTTGICTVSLTPPEGIYGNNAASFNYKIETLYNRLTTPEVWSTSEGTVNINVRPIPHAIGEILFQGVEDQTKTGLSISNGIGYNYAGANGDVTAIQFIDMANGHLSCGGSCLGACSTGTCNIPDLIPDSGWDRTQGLARITYKVKVTDPFLGTKWSEENTLALELLPHADVGFESVNAIEGASYNFSIDHGNGYTHVENAQGVVATQLEITAVTNLQNGAIGTVNCTAGSCALSFNPILTAFSDVGGGKASNNGKTWGWASFQYRVKTPVDAVNIWSPIGIGYIYFRPLPVAQNISFNAEADTDTPIILDMGAGKGYTHPFDYLAKTINKVGDVSTGTISAFSCPAVGAADEGKCTAIYNSGSNVYGNVTLSYTVTVHDSELNQDLTSYQKTISIDVRPKPIATAFNQNWSIYENNPGQTLAIELGALADKKGYFYPNGADPQYDIDPSHIYVDSTPNAGIGSFQNANFDCPVARSPKGCTNIFVPVAYGNTDFVYRVEVTDPVLGAIASNPSPATTIDIRPIIKAHNVTHVNNPAFRGIENQVLNWTIDNGASLGYIYPNDAQYNTARATVTIMPSAPFAGTVLASTPSCTNGYCSGTFTPNGNTSGAASFQFKLGVTDVAINQGSNYYESNLYTATIDLYPQPTTNTDLVAYTAEGDAVSLSIKSGGQGYTHLRDDNAFKVNVTALLSGTTPTVGQYTSCIAGTCTLNFTPSVGFTSDSDSHTDGAYVNYRVWVKESSGSLREAQSKNPVGKYGVVVYPRSVPSTANIQNPAMWAANANAFNGIFLGTGNGYTHKWNDKAAAIDITSTSAGLVENVGSSCNSGTGVCSVSLTPPEGTYGDNAASFTYKIQTVYNRLATPEVWSTATGTININVRPIPHATNEISFRGVEDQTKTGLTATNGAGYTYAGAAGDVTSIQFIDLANGHISCGASCTGSCTSGTCSIPDLIPDAGWDRTQGLAHISYKVKVTDPDLGIKWSEVNTLALELLPHADVGFEATNAIEGENYNFSIEHGSGYTHVENHLGVVATLLEITNVTNIDSGVVGTVACTAGSCPLSFTPILTAFSDVGGGKASNNGMTWGWASFQYRVKTPVEGVDIWSPTGIGYVYFRPLPVAQNLAFTAVAGYNTTITIENGAGKGYTHPFSYKAKAINKVGEVSTGTISNFSCPPVGDPNEGKCTATYNSGPDAYGSATLNYTVTVRDPVLNLDITSYQKTISIDIRPIPHPTGFASTWGIFQDSTAVPFNVLRGDSGTNTGYYYVNEIPAYAANHPSTIHLDNWTDSGIGSFDAGFSCSSGAQAKGCSTTFTPTTSTIHGPTTLTYRVSVTDAAAPDGYVTSLNSGDIILDVRPIVRPHNISYSSNTVLKGIENQTLNWNIKNGSNLGYIYPSDSRYNTVRSTFDLVVTNPSVGSVNTGAPSCSNGICSGDFIPPADFSGTATFNFKLTYTDSVVNQETSNRDTGLYTATVDFYPQPTNNTNLKFYTAQGDNVNIAISKAGQGYTHSRSDNAYQVDVTNLVGGSAPTAGSYTSCTNGNCTIAFSPSTTSSSDTDDTTAYINYHVWVRESSGTREAKSKDPVGKAAVVIYPRAVPDVTGLNFALWEGESQIVTLSKDAGYTHTWGDLAADINITSVSTGSQVDSGDAFICNPSSGVCDGSFIPKLGTYGPAAAYLEYKIKTNYARLTPTAVWSSDATIARLNFNVRPLPTVPTEPKFVYIENQTFPAGSSLTNGNGFAYGGVQDDIKEVEYKKITPGAHLLCQPSCNSALSYVCSGGSCPVPGLVPEVDWDRTDSDAASTDGLARIQYRVKADDPILGIRWTNWQTLALELIPQGRGTTKQVTNATESVTYNGFTIGLESAGGTGYTHVENEQAQKLKILSVTNIANHNANDEISCTNGNCSLNIAPLTTAFADVPGKSANNSKTYGWASFTYQVKHVIEGFDIWSTTGTAYIYFRPIPKPSDLDWTDATPPYGIENEELNVPIRLDGTGGCVSNCGYTHDLFHFATAIAVSNETAVVNHGAISCDGVGVCTVPFKSAAAGTHSFDYLVTIDGVQQITLGTATIKFVERPRNQNIVTTTYEGTYKDIVIQKGTDYTQLDGHAAQDVVIPSATILTGTIQQVVSGTPGACATSGSNTICACDGNNCTIRFTPRAWISGESNLVGSFSYKVRDSIYFEADQVTPLAALSSSTVTINMSPRIVTNSRNYPAGANQGVEDSTKIVEIDLGPGDTSTGGYTHAYSASGHKAKKIRIETLTDATITGCAGAGCELNCDANGLCSVPVEPLTAAAFKKNASFTYNIIDNQTPAFESHIPGSASVYFYPKPKTTGKSAIVAMNATTPLSASRGAGNGYTHLENHNTSSWASVDESSAHGSFNTWSCTGGNCTVNFVPDPDYYSPSAASPATFIYKVINNTASGNVESNPDGVYSVEIFPKPTVSSKTLYWVEGIGDTTAAPGSEKVISLKLGSEITHLRGQNPTKVIVTGTSGGSFSTSAPNEFSCSGDTCTATFTPSALSSGNANVAATFQYSVVVGGVTYEPFPSDFATIDIVVMPKPVGTPFTAEVVQSGSYTDFKFARVQDLNPTPKVYATYSHAWNLGIDAPGDITLVSQPSKGTVSIVDCTGGVCTARFTPTDETKTGTTTFTYKVRVDDDTYPSLVASTQEIIATIDILPSYGVTGAGQASEFYVFNNDPVSNPKTTVNLTISKTPYNNGNPSKVGYYNLINANANDLKIVAVYDPQTGQTTGSLNLTTQGRLINPSTTNGTWTATYESSDFFFGTLYLQYQVCEDDCNAAVDQKSPLLADHSKWIKIEVELNDAPPVPCDKTLIVYKNISKSLVIAKKGAAQAVCANGVWFDDANAEDQINGIEITTEPNPASGVLNAGANTTCSGSPRLCTCPGGGCTLTFVPTNNSLTDSSFTYKIRTHSELLGIDTYSSSTSTAIIDLVNALQPVANDFTVNGTEDISPTVNAALGTGYQSIDQINPALPAAPDGYAMIASDNEVVTYDTALFSNVTKTGCNPAGLCSFSVTPKVDANGVGTITYNVTANGVKSANKTITVNLAAVDDKPNTYGNDLSSLRFNKYQSFWQINSWNRQDGTFYEGGVGQPVQITLQPWTGGHPYFDNVTQGSYTNYMYGYHDVEGDKAVQVKVSNVVGGTITYHNGANDAFNCDANGICDATFTPNGTRVEGNLAYFDYQVCVKGGCDNIAEEEQTVKSRFNIYVSTGDSPAVNEHLPEIGTENPDIELPTWNPLYRVARDAYVDVFVTRGVAYNKSRWRDFPGTEYATKIEFGDGNNGAPAPTNGTMELANSVCIGSVGTCVARFKSLNFYESYPQVGTFWYRMVTGENYTHNGFNFGTNLVTRSSWKKVTVKILLNLGGGCDDAPSLGQNGHILAYAVPQGNTYNVTFGNGATAGNFYSHSGIGANWRPLQTVDITNSVNGSMTTMDCTTTPGVCTGTWQPTGSLTPGDKADDFVGTSTHFIATPHDDWGCQGSGNTFYVLVKPYVSTRDICRFNYDTDRSCFNDDHLPVTEGTSVPVSFRKRDAKALTAYGQYEYETIDNANATKIELYDFTTDQYSANPLHPLVAEAGVNCTGATWQTVHCTIDGAKCSGGTCTANFLAKDNDSSFGLLSFKYKVYIGSDTVYSKGVWVRNYSDYWPYQADTWVNSRDARYDLYIRSTPQVTNPTIVTSVNQDIQFVIGAENIYPQYKGYTYLDTEQFALRSISLDLFTVTHGQVLDISYDQIEKKATLTFRPDNNYVGNATIGYRVNLWDAPSPDGIITIAVSKQLTANDVATSTGQNQNKLMQFNLGTEYTQYNGSTYKASAIEVLNVNPSQGAVTGKTCNEGTGLCSFTFEPAADFYGTVNFNYKLESGAVGSKVWSNIAAVTIDVIQQPEPPIVYNMSFTGQDDQAKLIAVSYTALPADGPNYGYTDANGDKATKLFISNPVNGTTSPASPITCTNGICLVSFTASTGHYGNSTFDFNVETNGAQALTAKTITVDFVPILTATGGITANGVKNVGKLITVSHNNGYTYNPGALVNDLTIESTTNGTVSGIDCTTIAGTCTFTFNPTTNFVGDATFTYKVYKKVGETIEVSSAESSVNTISFANSDEAPVASNFTLILTDHNARVIDILKDTHYTDRENDDATTVGVVGSAIGGGTSNLTCTDGDCHITYTPTPNFQGDGQIKYQVTANGALSNIGIISITVPTINDKSFALSWGTPPTLSNTCSLQVPGDISINSGIETCGDFACNSYTGTIDSRVSNQSVSASATGINVLLNTFTNLGAFYSTWQVTDSAGTPTSINIGRFLSLSESAPSLLSPPTVSVTPSAANSMEGYQRGFEGCTGQSCSAQKLGSLANGDGFTCSLMADSSAMCWGSNVKGKLGINSASETDFMLPQTIKDPDDPNFDLYGVKAVTAGSNHACALLNNGKVLCWGDNEFGQLGNSLSGVGQSEMAPGYVYKDNLGTSLLTGIVAITAGLHHSCALSSTGYTYCWGDNSSGQLGDGSTTMRAWADKVKIVTDKDVNDDVVTTNDLTKVVRVSAGDDHTCALHLVTDGSNNILNRNVLCWGANTKSQLGDNDFYSADETLLSKIAASSAASDPRLYPVLVRSATDTPIDNVVSVTVGKEFSCLLLSDKTVQCWGSNTKGKAGVSDPVTYPVISTPTTVQGVGGTGNLSDIVSISSGEDFICGLKQNMNVVCWGKNTEYQLGNNSTSDSAAPVLVISDDPGGTYLENIYSISVGTQHSCGITLNGYVKCWGKNTHGELGMNDTATYSRPTDGAVNDTFGTKHSASFKSCSKVYSVSIP